MAVLKVLRQVPDSGSEKHFDRFLQEYELIARVNHPNVVRIFDLGVADDHAYIAMEYCSRGSLKRRIASGMTSEQAFAWMRVIAGALGALHAVGIYHRDLKPTNVMFREDDSLVLIDFGLAKQAQFKAGITGTGAIFGTPYYMSPEQGEGDAVDQRSDIYSLGVVFYEMLTGPEALRRAERPCPSSSSTARRPCRACRVRSRDSSRRSSGCWRRSRRIGSSPPRRCSPGGPEPADGAWRQANGSAFSSKP